MPSSLPPDGSDGTTDVLVIGGGLAGLSAAITAADHGARVIVVEKTPDAGGNCRYSGGNLIDTTGQDSLRHLEALCFGKTGRAVLAAYLAGLHDLPDWVEALGGRTETIPHTGQGGSLSECWPHLPGAAGVRYYRVRGPDHAGLALWNLAWSAAAQRSVPIQCGVAGTKLVRSPDGAVTGAVVTPESGSPVAIEATRGVILATGGFENDPASCDAYLPLSPTFAMSHLGNTGDGLRMATEAGASVWHMSNFFGWWAFRTPEYPAAFGVAFTGKSHLVVDADGRRFCAETGREVHDRIRPLTDYHPDRLNYPHLPMYGIFDDPARTAAPLSRGQGPNGYQWSGGSQRELDRGWVHQGDGPEAIAKIIGCDPATFAETLRDFNAAARTGQDPQFGRAADTMEPLEQDRLYAIEMWPGVSTTCGGPRRDEFARVIDSAGRPIPGLYAAGGNGAIWGHLTQHGGGLTDAMVFGRIAARHACSAGNQYGHDN